MTDDPNKITIVWTNQSPHWGEGEFHNEFFLRATQRYLGDLLFTRGHVFLNELYDALGMQRSMSGALKGWFWEAGSNIIDLRVVTVDHDMLEIVTTHDGEIYQKLPHD